MKDKWKKLSGENNWEGLLDPLDPDLKKFIDHCGKRVKAITDSTSDDDKRQPAHNKEDLFTKVIIEADKPHKLYIVTDYIYANSRLPSSINWLVTDKSAWIGYVAIATDEGKEALGRRDILICWRGTNSKTEWLKDFQFALDSASNLFGETHDPRVHKGFLSLYMQNMKPPSENISSARDQVVTAVKNLLNDSKYRHEEMSITVAGHSLGAALATLSAADIVANKHNIKSGGSNQTCMVTAIAFASPKVGDEGFRNVFNTLSNLHLLNIRHRVDIVTRVPPYPYKAVGIKLRFGSRREALRKLVEDACHQLQSSLQNSSGKFFRFHKLQEYLAGLQERRKRS